MPQVESYHQQHPWITPEPHLNPGYTGYLPGYGPKRIYQMAKTYGKMTHDIMLSHEMAGNRLAYLQECAGDQLKANQERAKVFAREISANDLKLRSEIVPGYAGYIPRKLYRYGKTYTPECREAVAEFQDIQMDVPRSEPSLVLPPRSSLQSGPMVPENRPYTVNKYDLQRMPRSARFETPVKYGEPFLSMGPLNPDKKFTPGYTGYVPGKPFHFGKTHANCSNAGLKETSYSLEEQIVLGERPSIGDWYVGRSLKDSEKIVLEGYHEPMPWKFCPPHGYGGFIPRYGHQVGVRYGESAKPFFNHLDLKNSGEISTD